MTLSHSPGHTSSADFWEGFILFNHSYMLEVVKPSGIGGPKVALQCSRTKLKALIK